MDVGSMISLGSYHTHIRRSVGRATIDANPIWLSQVDIQDLMRACGDGAAGEMSEVASKKGEYPVCLFAASGH
jgi:hypothetical protein